MGEALIVRRGTFIPIPYYEITIDSSKIDSNLTDFPVMVKATSSDYDMALLNDDNVYFTDMNDNLLDFEVEYASSTERVYHIRIPSISSSSNTQFRLKYDGSGYSNGRNPENVWDSNYQLVYHMGSSLNDSTSNNRNGSNFGSSIVSGLNGQGRNFDGSNDYVNTNYVTNLDDFSWTGVFETDTTSTSGTDNIICSFETTSQEWARLAIDNNRIISYVDNNGSREDLESNITISTNTYYYATVTRNGSSIKLYANGNLVDTGSTNTSLITSPNTIKIGKKGDNDISENFNGTIDEIRLSNSERSSAWIKAEYHSLFNTLISAIQQK